MGRGHGVASGLGKELLQRNMTEETVK